MRLLMVAALALIAGVVQAAEFYAPDEVVVAGISKHGSGGNYDFNERHLILGLAGPAAGLAGIGDARWEIGIILRDSYNCTGIYGAIGKSVASWKLGDDIVIKPGIALYAGNKCTRLSDGESVRESFILPLPVLRTEIGKSVAVESSYLPKFRKNNVAVLFATLRYRF